MFDDFNLTVSLGVVMRKFGLLGVIAITIIRVIADHEWPKVRSLASTPPLLQARN
jgi:hypothetical protein